MPVNYVNLFSYYDFSNNAHNQEQAKEGILTNERDKRKMIDFHAIANISDTHSFLVVHISHNDNFVPPFNKTLTKLVHMHLNTAQIRIKVITHKENIVLFVTASLLIVHLNLI